MTSGTRRGTVSIGLSGWQYDGWRGDFYPVGLPKRRWLEHVGATFPTVELNGSFYSLQRPSRYRTWRDSVPEGFTFAVKGGRYLTHMLRLRHTDTALANFFASGVLELGAALGPILWQLPEDFVPDPGVLDDFLASLPPTVGAGERLAALHDDKVRPEPERTGGTVPGRPVPPVRPAVASDTRIRYALEVRNHDATSDAHLAVLRRHDVALVDSDAGTAWPRFDITTSDDLAYLRLHGSPRVYHSGYSPQALGHWASRIVGHRDAGRDVVVYFDNDAERHAPWDALALMRLVARRSA
jgi:uncharacterized protein YecE (DUF72 family)